MLLFVQYANILHLGNIRHLAATAITVAIPMHARRSARLRASLALLFGWLILLSGAAAALPYRTGPVPAWVLPVAAPAAARSAAGRQDGSETLLSDSQTRIERAGMTVFHHIASKALDTRGVERAAGISMSFDPSYQALTLHFIRVIREGNVSERLVGARIRVLQREAELEYRIYDGRKTVNVVLDDVRVGDTVEYAFSTSGLNPVFGNLVAGGTDLQWGVPVARVFARLLVPQGRELALRLHNSKVRGVLSEAGGYRDYRWAQDSVPGLRTEKNAPPGFYPYAWVQWSEFPTWKAVSDWAAPLYQPPAAVGRDLARAIDAIRQASDDPAVRLVAVLQLVQRDIRYLAVATGAGSHAPSAPDVVYKRRFGDCKDKALLMLAMLKALGIDARAALVHTEPASMDEALLPTPHAFNHVMVRAAVAGEARWLDPTRALQQGALAAVYQPDYGNALVIDSRTLALEPMVPPNHAVRTTRVMIDARGGPDQAASYQVRTTLRGKDADAMRGRLASDGTANLEADYLDFYARTYPGIAMASPIEVHDTPAENRLALTESYAITQFWAPAEDGARRAAYVKAAEIGSRLAAPASLKRVTPLAIAYPDEIEEISDVRLPAGWKFRLEDVEVRDPAFEFTHSERLSADGTRLILTDRYRALADRVAPAAMVAYADNLRRARKEIGYTLYWKEPKRPFRMASDVGARHVAAVLLFALTVMLLLLWQTSAPVHRRTDLHLLLCFAGASALLVALSLLAPRPAIGLSMAATIGIMFVVTRVAGHAPASHWIHPLAHPGAPVAHPTGYRVLVKVLGLVTPLVAVAGTLVLLFRRG